MLFVEIEHVVGHYTFMPLSADAGAIGRSEGEAERDIGSTCMIGPGLVVVEKIFAVAAATWGWTPTKLGFYIKHVESRHA